MEVARLLCELFALLFAVLFASVLLHEAGHALAARLLGVRVLAFGVGGLKPWFHVRLGAVRVFFGSPFRGGVMFYSYPGFIVPPWRAIGMVFGGPVVNLAIAAAVALVWWYDPATLDSHMLRITFGVNALLGPFNLVPMVVNAGGLPLRSDGGTIWLLLRGKTAPANLPWIDYQACVLVSDFGRRLDSIPMASFFTAAAAVHLMRLGDAMAAKRLLEEPAASHPARTPEAETMRAMAQVTIDAALEPERQEDHAARFAEIVAANEPHEPSAKACNAYFRLAMVIDAGEPGKQAAAEAVEAAAGSLFPTHAANARALQIEADPPTDLAAAVKDFFARHQPGSIDPATRARLLGFTAWELARRGDPAAPSFFKDAADALKQYTSPMPTVEQRVKYGRLASPYFARATALLDPQVLLEANRETPPKPKLAPVFGLALALFVGMLLGAYQVSLLDKKSKIPVSPARSD
ncbi:MAG: M50 family metallopeptidase, partial [Planctomycetia bacterium]